MHFHFLHLKIHVYPLLATQKRKQCERRTILNLNAQNLHLELVPIRYPTRHNVLGSTHHQSKPTPFDHENPLVFVTPSLSSLPIPFLQVQSSTHVHLGRVSQMSPIFISSPVSMSSLFGINKYFASSTFEIYAPTFANKILSLSLSLS